MKDIRLTKQNIASVPIDWLQIRYGVIKRQLEDMEAQPDLLAEAELIESFICSAASVEQLTLDIPLTPRNQYEPIVEYQLEEYYRLLSRKSTLEAELNRALVELTPETSVSANYANLSGVTRFGTVRSPTETALIRLEDRIERYQRELREIEHLMYPIQRAMRSLSCEQESLIKRKYLAREVKLDESIIREMRLGRQKYYELKRSALARIAQSLGIL